MKKKRIVLALGHNALGTNLPRQQEAVQKSAKAVADFAMEDYEIVITHSNGPQVGMIHTAMSEFAMRHEAYTPTPMSVASAMSQGYIGYDLQNAIHSELILRGISRSVATILTQVRVDPYDEAFYRPSKIIGRLLTEEEALTEEKKGNHVTATEGGFRRIVATPVPLEIVEIDVIRSLLDRGTLVIACGGGGIPVIAQGNRLKGASAVIEKDTAAGALADAVDADMLVILTGVDKVMTGYGTEDERPVDYMSVAQASEYLEAGEFEEGTMAPKIRAAISFIGNSPIRKALITRLAPEGIELSGANGTMIGLK